MNLSINMWRAWLMWRKQIISNNRGQKFATAQLSKFRKLFVKLFVTSNFPIGARPYFKSHLLSVEYNFSPLFLGYNFKLSNFNYGCHNLLCIQHSNLLFILLFSGRTPAEGISLRLNLNLKSCKCQYKVEKYQRHINMSISS